MEALQELMMWRRLRSFLQPGERFFPNQAAVSSLALHKTVIPTGAYPNFLLRAASDDHACGSP